MYDGILPFLSRHDEEDLSGNEVRLNVIIFYCLVGVTFKSFLQLCGAFFIQSSVVGRVLFSGLNILFYCLNHYLFRFWWKFSNLQLWVWHWRCKLFLKCSYVLCPKKKKHLLAPTLLTIPVKSDCLSHKENIDFSLFGYAY